MWSGTEGYLGWGSGTVGLALGFPAGGHGKATQSGGGTPGTGKWEEGLLRWFQGAQGFNRETAGCGPLTVGPVVSLVLQRASFWPAWPALLRDVSRADGSMSRRGVALGPCDAPPVLPP